MSVDREQTNDDTLTEIRPAVLYGSETWSSTKQDETLLQALENILKKNT
jgi:hypothetical protein